MIRLQDLSLLPHAQTLVSEHTQTRLLQRYIRVHVSPVSVC